ncbi:MAG: Ldh family oxidoreductase [Clostridiales Family XIII bacterium]|jgi:LDH2 family malate/lactate/ureidoglycolate dehydrogenase|nr:Ldh family oxidoreductase [Clostridiales Family XIII bacterium]
MNALEGAPGSVVLDWETLTAFVVDVLCASGVPRADAEVCADVLIESDRRGIESHGVNRFKPIYIDRIKIGIQKPVTEFEILKETKTTAVIDGHDGMGQVIGVRAMRMAIDKAKEHGLGMTAVRNSTHYGIAGYYATMATDAGLIGLTGTNARPSIAPTFGVENMLGTNPLTWGMPTDEDFPFVIDCATSITQRGKVEYLERIGQDTPAGQVIDENGGTLTDSAEILRRLVDGTAALAPLGGAGEELGGYKGYGFATVVEILCAALQGGSYMKDLTGKRDGQNVPYRLGHYFLAIDPEAFLGLEGFRKTAGDILRQLRASRKAPGQDRIYTAYEKEYEVWQARKDVGVPINPSVQREFIEMRDDFGLTAYTFPWEQ